MAQSRVQIARLLIDAHPSHTAIRDKLGMDAFAHAARHGTNAVLTMLLSRPAPPSALSVDLQGDGQETGNTRDVYPHPFMNRRDDEKNTPLHHASALGHLKTLILLIGAGADVHARNAFSWTPVAYAASVNVEVQIRALTREREQLLRGQRQSGTHGSRDSRVGVQMSGFGIGGIDAGMMGSESGNSSPLRARGASDEKARQMKMIGRAAGGAVGGVRLVRSSDGEGTGDDEEMEIGLAMKDRRARGRPRV